MAYDKIQKALDRAKAEAAKEGRVDYDMDKEFAALADAYLAVWRRLEALRPAAAPQDQDREVR